MQHPVDTKADDTQITPRFNVDIRGALLESVLQQPVDDVDDVRVVGVELTIGAPEIDQLLE